MRTDVLQALITPDGVTKCRPCTVQDRNMPELLRGMLLDGLTTASRHEIEYTAMPQILMTR